MAIYTCTTHEGAVSAQQRAAVIATEEVPHAR
jgi:hypothetical protein